MKTRQQVSDFVCDEAKYYPNNPLSIKYGVFLNGKGVAAESVDALIDKICKKLKIK